MPISVVDEEIIYRSWDGDILKVNTTSNETDLLLKNTTFVSAHYCLSIPSKLFEWFYSFFFY